MWFSHKEIRVFRIRVFYNWCRWDSFCGSFASQITFNSLIDIVFMGSGPPDLLERRFRPLYLPHILQPTWIIQHGQPLLLSFFKRLWDKEISYFQIPALIGWWDSLWKTVQAQEVPCCLTWIGRRDGHVPWRLAYKFLQNFQLSLWVALPKIW